MPTKTTKTVTIGKLKPAKAVVTRQQLTLADEAVALLEKASMIKVRTQAQCTEAIELARQIRLKRNQWQQHERPVVDAIRNTYIEARDRYDRLAKPMKTAEDVLKEEIGRFKMAAKRISEATNRATNQILAGLQEQALQSHTQSVEDASARALERRQGEIDAAEAAGDEIKAQRLKTMPLDVEFTGIDVGSGPDLTIMLGPGELATALLPEDGVSVGEKWDYAIDDPDAVPLAYYSIDEKKIKAVVVVLKGATVIPGVRVFPKPKVGIKA